MRTMFMLAGASFVFGVSPAMSQNAASQTAPAASEGGLEEIVVTATKRPENLQNVPVSVTALSAEAIEKNHLADFSDLTRVSPSMTITQQTSSPNNAIILRGIGTYAFSIGVEPSVAVIIDDMPVVQQAQAFDNMADLARIEVLKGPQGTLFGKASAAGVVNIVTKDPGAELGGSVSATLATDGDTRFEGVLTGPLGERSGFRLTGFYHDFDGNVRDLSIGRKLNDQQNYGFRAKFKTELGVRSDFTLTAAYSKATQDGTGVTILSLSGTGTPKIFGSGSLLLVPSLTGISAGEGNYNARIDTAGPTSNETSSLAGKFNVDLGFANLISITAYQDWKYRFENDVDGTDLNVLSAFTSGAQNGGVRQYGPYHSTNFTQELRLVSSGTSGLKYVVGGFYSSATTDRAFTRGPVLALADWSARNKDDSLGIFGQLDYTLPSETTFSGGVRYNNQKIDVAFDNRLSSATANTCATGNPLCRGSHSDSVVTWKAAVSQQFVPQVMGYVSVARGYKGFAYDITSGFNPARINAALSGTGAGLSGVGPVSPETSTSYELGLKSRYFANRLQLNIAGYLTDYNDFQAQSAVFAGSPPTAQFVLNNVGKLRTKGVELELTAMATDWLRVDAGASYTDAGIVSFPFAQGYSGQTGQVWNGTASALVGNCVVANAATAASPRSTCSYQDRSGADLPNSPRFKWNVGATADFPLNGDAKGTAMLMYRHQSSVNFDLLGNPLLEQKGYGVLNGSFAVDFGRYQLEAFVNNLFDKHYASSLSDGFGTVGGNATNDTHVVYQFLSRDSERYFGLKATMKF